MRSGADLAAHLAERSAEQLARPTGVSGEEARKAMQKSSANIDAITQSGAVLTEVARGVASEWMGFTRELIELNFKRMASLSGARSPQEFAAIQSELVKDNLERFLGYARRSAESSMRLADEATRRFSEAAERGRRAA